MPITINKITVLIAVFCYLAASSIASAHVGISMGNTDASFYAEVVDTTGNTSVGSVVVDESMPMPCHSIGQEGCCNVNSACKLMCSAIGHALLTPPTTLVFKPVLMLKTPISKSNLMVRQLIVEIRPPK